MSSDAPPEATREPRTTGGRTSKSTDSIAHIAPGGASAGTELDEYSTPPQIARLLHIRSEKVRAWIASGELVAFDVSEHSGGRPRFRVHRDDLQAFLERRRAKPPPKPIRRAKYTGKPYV